MAAQLEQPVTPSPPPPPLPQPDVPAIASLYVGDLHPEVIKSDLEQLFRTMGPLNSVHLCRDRLSNASLCYAYINFLSFTDAYKALAILNHTELKGKVMRIMWCQRDPLTRKTGIGNLFVKNLDKSVTSARLHGLFANFGTILSCKVAEENGKSKGFGFVQFNSEDSALAAINTLHGSTIEGKKLYVSKFLKRSERTDAWKGPHYTSLYVKNLDESWTEDLLRQKFSECGKVCNVEIVKDGDGKSKGFGFVEFHSHEEAKNAVESLNGAVFGSKNLIVRKAQNKAERENGLKVVNEESFKRCTEKSNLFVKNLDPSIDDRKLKECFSPFGQVMSAKVMRHDNGISRRFGFVSFSKPEEASNALGSLNRAVLLGKPLYVAVAQQKEDRHKQLHSTFVQYSPQSLHSPNWAFHAQLHSLHSNSPPCPLPIVPIPVSNLNSSQPISYQYVGRNFAVYPFGELNYQRNICTIIPEVQLQQLTTNGRFRQQTTNDPMPDNKLGAHNDQKPFRKMWNKRKRAVEASFKGSFATQGVNAASTEEKCHENIGEILHPLVENLQPGSGDKITAMLLERSMSDIQKLLKSPKSLARQVEKSVQMLREANSRIRADVNVALPANSTRCLSY